MPFLDVTRLKHIKGARKKITFSSELPVLAASDGECSFKESAYFELTLTNLGLGAIGVEGLIKVMLNALCSRCLRGFALPLDVPFNEVYYDQNQGAPEGKTEEWLGYTGDEIDITQEVLGAVLMNLPMRFICDQGCKGLCSSCGLDLNTGQCSCNREEIDPRMAKLAELLKKK